MHNKNFLIGKEIIKINEVHDYIQIIFFNNIILNIFNNYYYKNGSIFDIKNKKVNSIDEVANKIYLRFDNGEELIISRGIDDFNGPEVMTLNIKGQPLIVWN